MTKHSSISSKPKLTLGPLYYHWPAEAMRDFYFRVADEAPVDCVYVGEVVCSKREPFFEPHVQEVIERLEKGGKQVVLSSLALLTLQREMQALQETADQPRLVEANDVAAIQLLQGRPFVVGPFINVMNEGTFDYMVAQGAKRIVFASELNGKAIAQLVRFASSSLRGAEATTQSSGAASAAQMSHSSRGRSTSGSPRHPSPGLRVARDDDAKTIETEVQIFGRQPLAVSMRCYHARANGRDKDHCRYACGDDPDGLEAQTIVGQSLLAINGTQTLTHGYAVLLDEAMEMSKAGVTHFRLAPQDGVDMVKVAQLYRSFLDGQMSSADALAALKVEKNDLHPINGFYHGREGLGWVG